MKLGIAGILMAITLSISAQNTTGTSNFSDGVNFKKSNLKGHEFLMDEWSMGFFMDINGNLSEEKLLNYNIYTHELTYKNDQKSIMVVNSTLYSGFMLEALSNKGNVLFKKINGSAFLKSKKVDKFYELVAPPSDKVIIESSKKLDDPNANGWSSSNTTTKTASYKLTTSVYILNKDQKYVKVKSTKSSILKALKSHKNDISAYIKNNGLLIKSPQDLVEIMEFYHRL